MLAHVSALLLDLNRLVASRRRGATAATLPGHGLYVGEADVDAALAGLGAEFAGATAGDPARIDIVGDLFQLSPFARLGLIAAIAPDVDARIGTVYAYLNDDVTARRLTFGLLLELAGREPWDAAARTELAPEGSLLSSGLVQVLDNASGSPLTTRPPSGFHGRQLRAADRVVRHALGDDTIVDIVTRCRSRVVALDHPAAATIGRLFGDEQWFVYLRSSAIDGAPSFAARALQEQHLRVVHVDFDTMPADTTIAELVDAALLEGALGRAALVLGPLDAIPETGRDVMDRIARAPIPVIVYGRCSWDPGWCRAMPALLDVPALGLTERHAAWQQALDEAGSSLDASACASTFHLAPAAIFGAVEAARVEAASRGVEIDSAALAHGARSQNGVALERMARRVAPRAGFGELVLPDRPTRQIAELVAWVQNRDRVIDEFAMRGQGTKGRGVAGLFVGASGTGKTLAAEVVAGELGLDLYVIDLSTVVSKYIGETEENLERVFREATGINGILFFDEADALFGKRSEVSDSKDRYANLEVAYLLQRMEQFDGLSLLASNLRANLDEAFTRRLDFVVTFPDPTPVERARIWGIHLPPELPRATDIDLDELGRRFSLAGGEIANAARAAAHAAARAGNVVSMAHLVHAVAREYTKIGRLLRPDEFGPWLDTIDR